MNLKFKQSALPFQEPCTILHARVIANAGGGPDKTIFNSPKYINPFEYRMELAYIHPEEFEHTQSLNQRATKQNCKLHLIPEKNALDPRTFSRLLKLCKTRNVKIFHAHDYKSNLLGLLLKRFHAMKLITTVHGWTNETRRTRLYRKLDQWSLKYYDHVITVSQKLHNQCSQLNINPDKLSLIYNAIELDNYTQQFTSSQEARKHLNLHPNRITLGVVGRLSIEKGIDRLIPIIKQLATTYPDIQLLVIGDGPERTNLQLLTKQNNLTHNIKFHGWQKDLPPYYQSFDLLLQPSLTEGLPNTLLEAMALKTPVAATPVGGIPELITHNHNGILLDPNPNQWHTQLLNLINDPAQQKSLVNNAQTTIHRQFSFTQRMKKITTLYNQLLNKPTSAENHEPNTQHNSTRSTDLQHHHPEASDWEKAA